MTTAYDLGDVPVWTLSDRLRKAREHAELNQDQLAGDLGISRGSIYNYEAGRTKPSRPTLMAWALRCGVPLWWLEGKNGPTSGETSGRESVARPKGFEPLTFWFGAYASAPSRRDADVVPISYTDIAA